MTHPDNKSISAQECRQENACPVSLTLHYMGGKWKPMILYLLSGGINRFGKLEMMLSGISKQVLTTQLREMEKDHLLIRRVFAQIPPRVEYALTPKGESLLPIIEHMYRWGAAQG
jgi:DNA-binding HxlR family transcriptional regulator